MSSVSRTLNLLAVNSSTFTLWQKYRFIEIRKYFHQEHRNYGMLLVTESHSSQLFCVHCMPYGAHISIGKTKAHNTTPMCLQHYPQHYNVLLISHFREVAAIVQQSPTIATMNKRMPHTIEIYSNIGRPVPPTCLSSWGVWPSRRQ